MPPKAASSCAPKFGAIHQKMRDFALRHQKQSNWVKKAPCALHGVKRFSRLMENVEPIVKDVVEMFLAVKEQ